MIRPLDPTVASFLRQAQLQLDWLNSEYSKLISSPENRESDLRAIENARLELLRLIEELS
jgi:hypothetical protein